MHRDGGSHLCGDCDHRGETLAEMKTKPSIIRGFVAFIWIMPMALLFGICNRKRAEKIGFVYRDAVKGFAEL